MDIRLPPGKDKKITFSDTNEKVRDYMLICFFIIIFSHVMDYWWYGVAFPRKPLHVEILSFVTVFGLGACIFYAMDYYSGNKSDEEE